MLNRISIKTDENIYTNGMSRHKQLDAPIERDQGSWLHIGMHVQERGYGMILHSLENEEES